MSKHVPVITIDGPSGTGKGTITQLLAQRLGWHLLDSGALYRVVAVGIEKNNILINIYKIYKNSFNKCERKSSLFECSKRKFTNLAGETT